MNCRLIGFLFLLAFSFSSAFAQAPVPLRYEQDLPKNLYSAKTAVLIGYTTNLETTAAEDLKRFNEYRTRLLADNQQLGLQLVHFADKNVLLQPAPKVRLKQQLDSLKVENLLFLDITDISGQGAQQSYVFLLTPYNHTAKLMTPKQYAFTQQADSYEKLVRNFIQQINKYSPNFFDKGPKLLPKKPTLTNEIASQPETFTSGKTPAKPGIYPLITLSAEDQEREGGGSQRNFYYTVGNDKQERNAGFFGQHLRKDIQNSPDALKELDKYRNHKTIYLTERIVFVSSLILYASEVWQERGASYFNDRQKVYIGLFGASVITHIIMSKKTNRHIFRAIDEYNTFATMRNNSGFYRAKPDNWGVGAVYGNKIIPGISLQWNLR